MKPALHPVIILYLALASAEYNVSNENRLAFYAQVCYNINGLGNLQAPEVTAKAYGAHPLSSRKRTSGLAEYLLEAGSTICSL